MNAERLLALYEQVAEAPDAVPRLRRFVLDLAVRGKLVAQEAGDEPAQELLKRIAVDKARLAKRGRKKEPVVADRADLIFQIPAHWQPIFVSQALRQLQTGPFGSSLHKSDYREGGTPVLNPASIQNGRLVPLPNMAVGPATLERLASFKVQTDDILMARRGEMGRCAVVTEHEKGWLCGTGSLILRPLGALFPEYLALVISSPTGRAFLGGAAVGTTMQNLNQSILLGMPFGLPPLAEQRRIVAKVEELMALMDRLEAARTAREATRDRLTAASLARLTAPDTKASSGKVGTGFPSDDATIKNPADFPANARFALATLPALTTRPDQIKPLRQTILNLAVRGKLVEQDPTDEPASELLKRIAAEKARLVKAKAIKKSKPLPAFNSDDLPFDLPLGWAWAQLGALIDLISGQHLQPPEYSEDRAASLPYITGPSDFGEGGLVIRRYALVRKAVATRGQLLLTVKGSGVGKATTCDLDEVAISRQLMALTAIAWEPEFLELVADRLATKLQEEARSLIPGISREDVTRFVVALPPLAEQHRIVAKVDALMALCDRLEAALTTADTTRARLLEALLHEALDPAANAVTEAAE